MCQPRSLCAQAILVLEAGCQRRTVVAPARLRAAAVYGLLGAPGPAAATFKELAVKHIQHDTITGATEAPRCTAMWDP